MHVHLVSKITGDVVAGGVTLGAILGYLPPISAVFGLVYVILQLYFLIKDRMKKDKK